MSISGEEYCYQCYYCIVNMLSGKMVQYCSDLLRGSALFYCSSYYGIDYLNLSMVISTKLVKSLIM